MERISHAFIGADFHNKFFWIVTHVKRMRLLASFYAIKLVLAANLAEIFYTFYSFFFGVLLQKFAFAIVYLLAQFFNLIAGLVLYFPILIFQAC